jgi:hypothetical protein
LNKNFSRRYLIVNEIFENLKSVYVDFNKMQTTMNTFIRLTQIKKNIEFHVFWNEFQRFMIEMNLFDHFLLIELKRNMFYRLQNVMFSEFNIVQNIYKLICLIQLKENHYKRINDVKSRKRLNTVAAIEIETKIAINRIMSIITISISINDKIESIFAESTIWNFNQYRFFNIRTSNFFKTFNLDSIKEKFMKANKCFNYNEFDHLNRDCSKFKKFKIAKMNVKNDTKKLKKKKIEKKNNCWYCDTRS